MAERFLLYIDILGFSEMVKNEPRKVVRVYEIINLLNSHGSRDYRTIVFSDTILIYNEVPARSDGDREHYVWYLTEFAEHLHHMLTGQDIFFRAVLVSGGFFHYQLENIDCFFGESLISAYNSEKNIPCLGMFMSRSCERYNRFFRVESFNEDFSFVYLNRHVESLDRLAGGVYPVNLGMRGGDAAPYIPWQVRFLKDIYHHMRSHPSPSVRVKFLNAWDFHVRRYPAMMSMLVASGFKSSSLVDKWQGWDDEEKALARDIRYFKRIGSGSLLSKAVTGGAVPQGFDLPVKSKGKRGSEYMDALKKTSKE